jgi:hypothetical protein
MCAWAATAQRDIGAADSDTDVGGANQHGDEACKDSFIRKHVANYEEIDQESLEVISCPKNNGEHDTSMSFHDVAASPPPPQPNPDQVVSNFFLG